MWTFLFSLALATPKFQVADVGIAVSDLHLEQPGLDLEETVKGKAKAVVGSRFLRRD